MKKIKQIGENLGKVLDPRLQIWQYVLKKRAI
jgi:hypothetical protein